MSNYNIERINQDLKILRNKARDEMESATLYSNNLKFDKSLKVVNSIDRVSDLIKNTVKDVERLEIYNATLEMNKNRLEVENLKLNSRIYELEKILIENGVSFDDTAK